MQIEVRTDSHISGSNGLNEHVEEWLHRPLDKYSQRLTRVEVHLTDVNGEKNTPQDKCCKLEARIRGRPPIAVVEHADSVKSAVTRAAAKLDRALEKDFGKLATH